jgi:hypothetical protein
MDTVTELKMMYKHLLAALVVALLMLLGLGGSTLAQGVSVSNIAITPNPVTQGQTANVVVTGTGFTGATTLSVEPGAVPITPSSLTATEIRGTIPNTLVAGNYSLQVIDAGNLIGSTAFTVNAAPTSTPPPVVISGISPTQINQGLSGVLVINGSNFTGASAVVLVGVGNLSIISRTNTQIQAAIPATLSPGSYGVQVTDPVNGTASSPQALTVVIPPPTAVPPQPTEIPPQPTPLPPPTEVPGAPSIIVRAFRAEPGTIRPGDTVTFLFDIVNVGSRPALGVSVTVDPGGKFIPSNGQSSVLLPDLAVGAIFSTQLSVIAANDTPGGPQSVTVTFNFRDFAGQSGSSKGTLTVNVDAVARTSQVTLSRYQVNPNPIVPGEPVIVTILVQNTGNATASQVLASVAAENAFLLAGSQGNSFPIGDIAAGASASVDMPLIVATNARSGPQTQNLTITYLQGTESRTFTAGMTMEIQRVEVPAPIMLIDSFETGLDFLTPGQEFTLNVGIKNIGSGDASAAVVTFGNVDAGNNQPDPSGTPDAGGGSTGGVTTTTSNTFAPLRSGGAQFVGEMPAQGDTIALEQDFIVNGSVDSGVYSLPVTIRYRREDGTTAQDNLRVSLVVIVQPQLRINAVSPLPPEGNIGESFALSLEIANRGRKAVNFTNAVVTADNAEVIAGEDTFLGPLRNDDQTTLDATIIPNATGSVTLTVTLNYTDDLNQPQQIVETYTMEAVEPPPLPDDFNPFPDGGGEIPLEPTPPSARDQLGSLLLGLLGLGS